MRLWRLLPWLLVVYLTTGIYSVATNERVVVRRFGRWLEQVRTPGLHFGLPYGIDQRTRIRLQEQKRVLIGMGAADRLLRRRTRPQDAECLTGDRNLIMVSAAVQYQINDPGKYLFDTAEVESLVAAVAQSELGSIISSMSVDDVLTVERHAIQIEVRTNTQKTLDEYGAGVRVTSVLLDEKTEPPQEVDAAFRDVTSAREDRQRRINEELGDAARLKQQTEADVDTILQEAQADATEVVAIAEGDKQRFLSLADELSTARDLTAMRLILETMEEVLPRVRKIVIDGQMADRIDLGLIEVDE